MLKTLIHNLHVLCVSDIIQTNSMIQSELDNCKFQISFLKILAHSPECFKKETEYIKKHGLCYFPYGQVKMCDRVISGKDDNNHLPYVMHHNKRLYFPKSFSVERCARMYSLCASLSRSL